MLSFLLLVICFSLHKKNVEERILHAVVAWNVWSFVLVEVLSLFKGVNVGGILCGWGILDVSLLMLLFIKRKEGLYAISKRVGGSFKAMKVDWWYMLPIVLGIVIFGLSAITVPYNWDSLTYHLSRIGYWAQNASVAHYATHDVRQLSSPVLAEFVNVQVYILSGFTDKWLNLLQAGSYFLNAYIVFSIARKLGCKDKFAILGTLLFMTMPISFGEALTTQVDQFATIWFLIFVYYFVDIYESEGLTVETDVVSKCIMMGLCFSLGYLAKPSVNIGMAVLLVFLLVKCICRKDKISVLLKIVVCVIPFVFVPLIPELLRNYRTFSAFSDPIAGQRQLIGTLAPHYVFINMLKNFVHNIPSVYLYDSGEILLKIVTVLAGVLRVNINDPSISEDGMMYMMNETPVYGHDTATNPVVMILAIVCVLYCLICFKNNKSKGRAYTIYMAITFVVFCALLRWEPFVSRYMLSYLAGLCPMIVWQVQEMAEKGKMQFLKVAVVPIICFCLVTEAFSLTRYHQELQHEEVSVRPYAYFYHNKSLKEDYFEVMQWVNDNNYQDLGLCISSNQFLWPVWAMVENKEAQIEYVLVDNVSSVYEKQDYIPDCIITDGLEQEEQIEVHGKVYKLVDDFIDNENLRAFLKIE